MIGQFTLLIGSCARGTADPASDIDVVRIGHSRAVDRAAIPEAAGVLGPINYVDYDQPTFFRLYQLGSLFIQHMLGEGKLVRGSATSWMALQESFRVQNDFTEEIEDNLDLYRWLEEPSQFENAEYPLLSHAFRALKNLAIFSMAQRRIYLFEKREVLGAFLPHLPVSDIDLLIRANRIYERNLESVEIPSEVLTSSALAQLFNRIDCALNRSVRLWSQ